MEEEEEEEVLASHSRPTASKAPGMRKEAREGVFPSACAAAILTLKLTQEVRAI